jgi:hypothetical protein
MITLFQNDAESKHYEQINAMGRSEAMAEYPAIEVAMDTRWDGAKAFDAKYFEFWSKVAEIDTDNLEEAFHIHNCGIEAKITRFEEQHSMSVGDILFDGTDYFMCDREGFAKLAV